MTMKSEESFWANKKVLASLARAFAPPPDLTISQWADAERALSPESSASPGKWRTDRAEYLRGIMDAVSDPEVEEVDVEGCSQFGKTEVLLNIIGFYMQHDPAPMLLVQPTLSVSESFSKDRFSPMIRDTRSISMLIEDPRTRDSGNTILHKQFPGGHITMAGANSPASLASRPIRIVLCDEVDRYEASAGTEGDPVDLARRRTVAFWNRKVILTSSPTRKRGRIHQARMQSCQYMYMVRCQHCLAEQRMHWNPLSEDLTESERVCWVNGDPESARYVCAHCGVLWEEQDRLAAIVGGKWISITPRRSRKKVGFHVSGVMVTWRTIPELVTDWIRAEASGNNEKIKTFINTGVGDPFEDEGVHIEDGALESRAEIWTGSPEGVYFTTCGVDVQDDRLEMELVGWGPNAEESWSLDYNVITGDPATPAVWIELDDYLKSHSPSATCIDSGGHHTQQVYGFCRTRRRRRIYAIKGSAGEGKIVWPREASRGKGGAKVYVIGVDSAKDAVFAHFKKLKPGPGFCHLPKGRPDWWFGGLTSESVFETHKRTGMLVREYRRRPGFKNEPLDCRVYAFAAMCSFGTIQWSQIAERYRRRQPVAALAPDVAPVAPDVVAPPSPPQTPRQIARAVGWKAQYAPVRTSGWTKKW